MHLYTGTLFRKAARWAELHCDEWAILSAEHGLVMPDQVIRPYERTLAKMLARERGEWRHRVRRQIEQRWPRARRWVTFVVLAGKLYADAVHDLRDPFRLEQPLRGLGIGQQLQWLTRRPGGARAEAPEPPGSLFDEPGEVRPGVSRGP